MRRSRPDRCTKEAVENLRRIGVACFYTQGLVPGFPDVMASYRGRWHAVEFKELGKWLSEEQVKFYRLATGCIHVVHSSDEAMRFIRECRSGIPAHVEIPSESST